MPCSPPTTNIAPGPSPAGIAGFGTPFSPSTPSGIPSLPAGQPEDLNALFSALQFLTPANVLKPSLHSTYDRTPLDAIMSLLNQFMPFLSLYNMLLPVLNIIVCIIEVLCALINPFALISKIQNLFRVCIPEFLALFPQFALIVMILSLINLLIALLEYIIIEVTNLVALIQQNINIIQRALTLADDRSILSATEKIGNVLCAFQNLFVYLSLFETILAVIQTIIKLLFPIPPCSDSSSCCTSDVCPAFIRNNTDITASTGTLQYYPEAAIGVGPIVIPIFVERSESWQFYDTAATIPLAFYNITKAYDLPDGYTTIFFPTDASYSASTPPNQAPYLVSLRVFYNPISWDATDPLGARFIRINNCIVTAAPLNTLSSYNNSQIPISTGVLEITGGLVFEDDNVTPTLVNGTQASLNTLIHMPANVNTLSPPVLSPTDGYVFTSVTYDFTIQHPILLGKGLITLGCIPNVGLDRTFINTVFGNNANYTILNTLALPDVAGAQTCLAAAVTGLQASVSTQSLATFQATTTACLSNLRNQAVTTAIVLINAGFDPYKSSFTVIPKTQFTTQSIVVSVSLVETNSLPLAANLPPDLATTVAQNITATTTFGQISSFTYDGYSLFIADITSTAAGQGTIQIAYQNQIISTVTIPTDLTQTPTITPTLTPYTFIYSPSIIGPKTSVGDTEGHPRLGSSDISDSVGD